MINFDFSSGVDGNGFVRLSKLSKFKEFIDMFNRMDTTVSENPHNSLYKKTGVKVLSFSYGELDFEQVCAADMFITRVTKYLPKGWMILSLINGEGKRESRIINVWKYSYTNLYRSNTRSIVFHFFDVSSLGTVSVNIDDLDHVCIRLLTEKEVNVVNIYNNLLNGKENKPVPIHKVMRITETYKKDYNLYIEDCNKYGFNAVDKILIEKVSLSSPVYFSEEGYLEGNSDDTEVVNE